MEELDIARWAPLVRSWLSEDIGSGDKTTAATVSPDIQGRARIEAREHACIAGLPLAELCFAQAGAGRVLFSSRVSDGDLVDAGDVIASLEGSLAAILTVERTALNILQRLSGVATITARYVAAIEGTSAKVVDTRKTTPGLRELEKYAVRSGGGSNHRMRLDDALLVKDNHIAAAGGVTAATRAAVASGNGLKVQVEVTGSGEAREAIAAGAQALLLDNMTPGEVAAVVEITAGAVELEASGGITLENIREYAETGVDRISIGALTHSAPAIDIALEVED